MDYIEAAEKYDQIIALLRSDKKLKESYVAATNAIQRLLLNEAALQRVNKGKNANNPIKADTPEHWLWYCLMLTTDLPGHTDQLTVIDKFIASVEDEQAREMLIHTNPFKVKS